MKRFINRLVFPVCDLRAPLRAAPAFMTYFRDWRRYSRMPGAEKMRIANAYPCLLENTEASEFDAHYFYQGVWAFNRVLESGCESHVDVGSKIDFVGLLSTVTNVTFVDIRPLEASLPNLECKGGLITEMPYETGSVSSLSCLHVAEHVGLGRYGDPIDPLGTAKAARELSRILAPGGNLYFSLPIGEPMLCFNAHRIHSTGQMLEYFSDLELVELSGIDDSGTFARNMSADVLDGCAYGCGLFWFTKG